MDPAVAFRRPSAHFPRTRPSVLQDNEVPIFGSQFNLFRQLHEKSRVLQDDTTQNNQYLIEIQKFNNKIILRAKVKVLQWALRPPFRNEAARYVRCCSRVKKSLARQKGSARRGGCNLGQCSRRNASYSRHVLAQYDEKFLCDILFNFFEASWLADDVRPSQHPSLLVEVTK